MCKSELYSHMCLNIDVNIGKNSDWKLNIWKENSLKEKENWRRKNAISSKDANKNGKLLVGWHFFDAFFWLKISFTSTLAKYVDVKTSAKVLFESCKSISIDSKKFGVVFLCRHCIFLSNNLWSFRTLYSRVTFAGRCLTGDVFVCFFVCVWECLLNLFLHVFNFKITRIYLLPVFRFRIQNFGPIYIQIQINFAQKNI